jgi:hypothetical protein
MSEFCTRSVFVVCYGAGDDFEQRPIETLCPDPETDVETPPSEYSTTFLYTQRPLRSRRHTVPQTSRPVIDRLGMSTRQRCQASGRACSRSEPTAESILRLLAFIGSSQRYLESSRTGLGNKDELAATQKEPPPTALLSRLRAAQRRNGTRPQSAGASTRYSSCPRVRHRALRQRRRGSKRFFRQLPQSRRLS